MPIDQADDAIGDCKFGVDRDLRLGVLADEQGRGSPACHVDREIVDEGPDR